MNTLEYMKSIGIKGEIEITLEQRAKLAKEGVSFFRESCRDDGSGLKLVCPEAKKLEHDIKKVVGTGNTWYIHDIWVWTYLESTYLVSSCDGGIHFGGLTIYYQEEA